MKKQLLVSLLLVLMAFSGIMATTSLAASPADSAPTVNINLADTTQFQALPGIGPALAKRIVEHRDANGPFSSIDQLTEVKGVGQRKLEKFRDRLVLE